MDRGVTIYRYVSVSGYKGHDTIYRFRLLNADTYLTLIKILANLQFVLFHETPGWLSDNRHDYHRNRIKVKSCYNPLRLGNSNCPRLFRYRLCKYSTFV